MRRFIATIRPSPTATSDAATAITAIAITLAGNRLSRTGAGIVATGSVVVAFAGALVSFFAMLGKDGEQRSELSTAWTWVGAGDFHAGLSVLVDPLSVFMMLVVSGVGALIVGYSLGYMHGENEERRFFAYMALFVFSMLLLVESGNLLLLLAGWGMVGLCSYLLIGFNQERPAAIAAAKKAFIMNALGDATMALALFLLIQHTGKLDYTGVFAAATADGRSWWNPISRYELSPTRPQPTRSRSRFPPCTSISIANTNSAMYAK